MTRGTGHLVDYSDGVRISQHQAHVWCVGQDSGVEYDRRQSPLQKQ